MKFPLILASSSPRRKKLLEQLGLPFKVVPPQIDETTEEGIAPDENAALLARRKAESVARKYEDHPVLGADTVVVLGEKLLGKPRSPEEAAECLRVLSGKQHLVITGLSLVHAAEKLSLSRTATTKVWMEAVSEAEIEAYVASGEPMDKAGAYAIQGKGAFMVKRIEGCYSNVVGLPLNLLARTLREAGLDIWKLMRGE